MGVMAEGLESGAYPQLNPAVLVAVALMILPSFLFKQVSLLVLKAVILGKEGAANVKLVSF
jgi:hypothetical protein